MSTSGLKTASFIFGSWPMSGNVSDVTDRFGMVANIGIALDISRNVACFRFSALFYDSATVMTAILNSGIVTRLTRNTHFITPQIDVCEFSFRETRAGL